MNKLAWLGDPGLKEEVLLRMKQHRAEDSIIQGHYQIYAPELASQFRGCLLGCTLPVQELVKRSHLFADDQLECWGGWHMRVEKLYGIPFKVTILLEGVFEALPFQEAAQFAVDSIEAIPVGADLSEVSRRWETLGSRGRLPYPAAALLTLLREAPVPESVD